MPRSPRPRLEHVRDACDAIARFTAGKTFDEYEADPMLMAAVERQFLIIGEALRAAESIDAEVASKITRFRKIIDFRNVLVHDYATVYPEGIWEIIRVHLPKLRAEVDALLSS